MDKVDFVDEPVVSDPTLEQLDLRLTRREWIIYWKSKFEASLQRIVLADTVIKKMKLDLDAFKKENQRLRVAIEEAQKSHENMVRENHQLKKKK